MGSPNSFSLTASRYHKEGPTPQPIPEPIPLFTGPFDPTHAQPAPSTRPRCRALTVSGLRCKKHVLGGLHVCFSHYRNRRPALPAPRNVSVPLLEDRSAIQLMTTQILHGILSLRLDPLRARAALYALRIAALTLPPAGSEAEEPAVCRLARDHEDFISADGDLTDPPLNPSCSVPESVEAERQLLDAFDTENHCHPELDPGDMPHPDPTHDVDRCVCFTCSDYRDRVAEFQADLHTASGG